MEDRGIPTFLAASCPFMSASYEGPWCKGVRGQGCCGVWGVRGQGCDIKKRFGPKYHRIYCSTVTTGARVANFRFGNSEDSGMEPMEGRFFFPVGLNSL